MNDGIIIVIFAFVKVIIMMIIIVTCHEQKTIICDWKVQRATGKRGKYLE